MSLVAALVLGLAPQDPDPAPVLLAALGEERRLVAPRPFDRLAASPSGRRAAAGSLDGRLRAWDLRTRRLLLDAAAPEIVDLLLPDDETLLAAHADGTLRVWSLIAPEKPTAQHVLDGPVRLVPAGPGDVWCLGREARRIDWLTGRARGTLEGWTPEPVAAAAVDGPRLFTAQRSAGMIEWDGRTGKPTGRFEAKDVAALGVDGGRLLSGHADGRVLAWDPAAREPKIRQEAAPKGMSPIVACGAWGSVHASGLYRRPAREDRRLPVRGAAAAAVAGGSLLVAEAPVARDLGATGPWALLAWDPAADREDRSGFVGHAQPILEAAVRGRRVASRSPDAILLWNADTGDPLVHIVDRPAAFSLTTTRLLTLSGAGAELWDAETGRRLAAWPDAAAPAAVLLRPDDGFVLVRGETLERWDARGRTSTTSCGAPIASLHPHPDGAKVVVGHIRSYAVVGEKIEFQAAGTMLAKGLSADGARAATCSSEGDGYRIDVRDLTTGAVLARRSDPAAPTDLVFGGGALFVAWADQRVARWDGAWSERKLPYRVDLLAAADGRTLLIGSGAAWRAFDLETGRASAASAPHAAPLGGLVPCEGGALTFSADRTLRLWRRP